MSAGKIQTELSQEGKELWASRSLKDYIVLMDWNSSARNLKTPIKTLQNILLSVSLVDGEFNCRKLCITVFSGIKT